MPHTVIASVGARAGRDFPTLAAFAAALPSDLTARDERWIAELYADAPDPGGAVFRARCDAMRRIEIRAAAGEGLGDRLDPATDPVRPDIAYGALIEPMRGDALRIEGARTRLRVAGVQILAHRGAAIALGDDALGPALVELLIGAASAAPAVTLRGAASVARSIAILTWGDGAAARLERGAGAISVLAARAETVGGSTSCGPSVAFEIDRSPARLRNCAATAGQLPLLAGGAPARITACSLTAEFPVTRRGNALWADLRPARAAAAPETRDLLGRVPLGPDLFGRARPPEPTPGPIELRPATPARPAPLLSARRRRARAPVVRRADSLVPLFPAGSPRRGAASVANVPSPGADPCQRASPTPLSTRPSPMSPTAPTDWCSATARQTATPRPLSHPPPKGAPSARSK